MENILFYLKQSISIFNQNRVHIVPSFIILLLVLNFSFYSIINFSKFKSSNSSSNIEQKKENQNFLRFLNQKVLKDYKRVENEEIKLFNLLEAINSNVTELALYYEFVENITSHSYYGRWENLKMDKDKFNFIDNSGEIELNFQKKRSENYLLGLNQKNNSNISVSFIIKDGEYIDNYIVGNFTFNFKNIPLMSYLNKNSFSIILENINLTYAYGHYMDIGKKLYINKTNINMTFYKKPEQYINKINHIISSTEYSIIDFNIKSVPDLENNLSKNNTNKKNENILKNFEISFSSKAYGVQKYPIKILNYSILLTFAAFIEIYFSTKFLVIINENVQMALNIDLITVFIQIMWTALICGVNFFLSLTYEPLTYEYGMPSMTYFTLFSIFLLRILFIGWKSRYIELLFNDISRFRKKLFQFYLIFYCLLLCTLVSIKLWYTYFIFTFFLFGGTWIFQIYYSVKKGTKPPMPYSYIFITSLFKMLIPIYLKAYNNNIFSLRPSYLKVFLCISIVFVEAIIVSLQKLLGPKFFIPERYREQTFDYYKSAEDIPDNRKSSECVICLENLENLEINNQEDDDEVFKANGNYIEKLAVMIQKWNKKKNNKPYMKTPCGHIFHTRCLETWLEIKNECPYCRQKIPPLES
jgi:hypothetical protein